jgi:O-antigen ligase
MPSVINSTNATDSSVASVLTGALDLQIESAVFLVILMSMLTFAWVGLQSSNNGRASPSVWQRNPTVWIAAVLAAILLLAGIFTASFGLPNALLAIEFAMMIPLALASPTIALGFFVSLLFMRPWEVISDPPALLLAMPRLAGVLAIASWAFRSLRRLRFDLHWDRSTLLLLALAGWLFAVTFRAPVPADAQREWLDGFFRGLMLFFLCVNTIRTRRELKFLLMTLVLSIGGLGLISLYQFLQLPPEAIAAGGERLQAIGNLANSNDVAAIMIMGLPLAIYALFGRASSLPARAGALFFSGLTLMAIAYSKSRGAYLSVFVIAALWTLSRVRHKMLAIGGGILLISLSLPVIATIQRSSSDLDNSTASRLIYWKAALRMAARNPLTGVGFNQYPAQYELYTDSFKYEWGERTVHSSWLLALAEAGIPGFLLLMAFFFEICQKARRILAEEPALTYSLAGYATAITFLSHTYFIYPYILFGLVVAAARVYAKPQPIFQRNPLLRN